MQQGPVLCQRRYHGVHGQAPGWDGCPNTAEVALEVSYVLLTQKLPLDDPAPLGRRAGHRRPRAAAQKPTPVGEVSQPKAPLPVGAEAIDGTSSMPTKQIPCSEATVGAAQRNTARLVIRQ